MLELTLVLCVLLVAFMSEASGRGARVHGVSWFDIAHEMHGTSKKARGRMQQRKHRR